MQLLFFLSRKFVSAGFVKHNVLHHFYADFSQVNREGLVFEASRRIYFLYKKTRCPELEQVIKSPSQKPLRSRYSVHGELKTEVV